MLVPWVGGPPTIPPSTKDAPAFVTTRPTSRAVLGETALASTNTPVNPAAATWSATARAACGGQTEKMRSLAPATAATVGHFGERTRAVPGSGRRGLPPPRGRRDRGRRRARRSRRPSLPDATSRPARRRSVRAVTLLAVRARGSRRIARARRLRAPGRHAGRRRPARLHRCAAGGGGRDPVGRLGVVRCAGRVRHRRRSRRLRRPGGTDARPRGGARAARATARAASGRWWSTPVVPALRGSRTCGRWSTRCRASCAIASTWSRSTRAAWVTAER